MFLINRGFFLCSFKSPCYQFFEQICEKLESLVFSDGVDL
jgi:hypothetical protein